MKVMKNLLICAACLAALLSCDRYDGVTIANRSAQAVSFEYNGGSHTLNSDSVKVFEVAWYTPAPDNIKKKGGGTIKAELTGHYEFIDADPIDLLVVNNYSRKVVLEAEDYIDADGSGTTTVIILDTGEKTPDLSSSLSHPVIYTKKPNFRAKDAEKEVYLNIPVKYHYFHGGTMENEAGVSVTVDPSMSVVIGP
jgi:hypothetical protein